MWTLTAGDLLQLRGAGGERFTHFVDRLIRAEAACGGLAQSEIVTGLRVDIQDGGVDTEMKGAIPSEKSGWFAHPTCWQFKAVEANTIDDKKKKKKQNDLQKEIHKPYAEKLIKNGYGYRLCILGNLTAQKLSHWESQLTEEAQKINALAPESRVINAGHLLQWAERFPAVVAWLKNLTQGVFHWEAWKRNCRDWTPTYVPNPDWQEISDQIIQHASLEHSQTHIDPCFYVGGAAGVGKTRLVFESLEKLPQAAGIVLYAEDEQEAKRVATAIANTPNQAAVLVADECSPETRHFLNENLRGSIDRLRVICLDNTGERLASVRSEIWLTTNSEAQTEQILDANFDSVPTDRRFQYARFSGGFVRLAADMCRRDTELAAGQMTGLLKSVERYVRHRLRKEHIPFISTIGLFHKVGFAQDASVDLDALCQLTNSTPQQFHDAVRAIKDSPGFVVQAGRYWYVTPEIVARVLFAEGWQRWVSSDPEKFFKKLPQHLQQQLVERVATHAEKEVRDQFGQFFRTWFNRLTALDLADGQTASLAAAIIETAPADYLPLLRCILDEATVEDLQNIRGRVYDARWGPRRILVWLLERLVSFPEFFEDCEACLFRLGLAETEQQISNNATGIWTNLFHIFHSGTALPISERIPRLRLRTQSSSLEEVQIGFRGVRGIFERSPGKPIGKPIVAGRLRPNDWQPNSRSEEIDSYRLGLRLCQEHLTSDYGDKHRLAFQAILENVSRLLRMGLLEELRRILTKDRLKESETRQLTNTVERFLMFEEATGRSKSNDVAVNYVREIKEWLETFRPADFDGLLRKICSRDPWRNGYANPNQQMDELSDLAVRLVKQPELLSNQLDWLADPEARSAEGLGFALGQTDTKNQCGTMVFEHAISHKAAPLLRGYVRGLAASERQIEPVLLRLMSDLEKAHPELAADILSHAGDGFDSLSRVIALLDANAISPSCLAPFAMGVGQRQLTTTETNQILPYFQKAANAGDSQSARAGIRFLSNYLYNQAEHPGENGHDMAQIQSSAWALVESALPYVNGHDSYEWLEIVNKLAAWETKRAIAILCRALMSDYGIAQEAENALVDLAKRFPADIVQCFGKSLLDHDQGWKLQAREFRELIGALPAELLKDWIEANGVTAARAISRHLPAPYINEAGDPFVPEILDFVLSEFDDAEVAESFLAGVHSGTTWWGNGADRFRQDAKNAEQFLNHPNAGIRKWAKSQIAHSLHLAEWEDQEHAERLLPQ